MSTGSRNILFSMKKNISRFLVAVTLLLCGVNDTFAQERPKVRQLSEKKAQVASKGLYPLAKKEKWGYADAEGKFLIRPVFTKVMPMGEKQVGFVAYQKETGAQVWTPIKFNGVYLTEQEFDKIIVDFDDRGLAVVRKEGAFGVIKYTGDMVADCIYSIHREEYPVSLLRTATSDWVVIVRDGSDEGYTVYDWAVDEPIIVKADNGYGIISPRNQSIVADFIYDSVVEYIPNSVYGLQKDEYKYLYADDKLSVKFEEVIPGPENVYFVVKDSLYGVMSHTSKMLAECQYATYLDRNPAVLLRTSSSDDWTVVVKDGSEEGSSVYTFGVQNPIIVKAEGGYGIISPRNQSIVADFIYDSYLEYIPNSVYCLQKDDYKYIYADDKVSEKFEDVFPGPGNVFYVVKQDDKYGVMSHTSKMLAECKYTTCLDRGPAALLRAPLSTSWTVVVKDGSEEGSSVYSFAENEPIIAKSDCGYGIISPRNQSIVADFIYDSVQEHVPGSVYGLQKGDSKYLYADDKLSVPYEEVIPGPENAYFVVKQDGKYGVMSHTSKMLAECQYVTYLDRGPAALLGTSMSRDWTVVVKDGSEEGSTVYTFGENVPVIAKSDNGYGIISPRNQSIVAEFEYDSVKEYVANSVYCLQKGDSKYLYADDKLSVPYEEVIPGPDNAYFVVKHNGLYGVMSHTGKMLAECRYSTYLDRGPAALLQASASSDWTVVVRDDSQDGSSVYTFGENEPIIAKSVGGYGIISPRNQSIVAEFAYDSVEEYVKNSVYGLQKGADKYLYADDKLSVKFENVIPGPGNVYYVVKQDGKYGVMSHTSKMLAECIYSTYLDRGPATLLRASKSTDWTVVVKDGSEEGSSVYTFAENSPVIVKSDEGYGVISPRNQSIVAEFVYDSVEEYVKDSVYCLQKGDSKYLYADDKLSDSYEEVIPDSENSYFTVKQNGLYGVVNQVGKPVVDKVHTSYLNRDPVLLLRPENSTDWVAIVKDNSEVGYTVYGFAENAPVIAKAREGYGIISPRDQSIVADFIYDSVQEHVPGSVYGLQKGADKYLYADDKLSVKYEEVIPGPGNVYYVVNQDGQYGVMSHTGKMLVECVNSSYLYSGPAVLLRTSASTDWTVVVKDGSEEGSSVYTFAENSPVIVKSDEGYGIISPRNQSIVAEFVYDSVQEFIADSVYCLQKGDKKYLYADDKMSVAYEDVVPDAENEYFVVKYDGLYGVLDQKGNVVVDCMYTTYLNRGPVLQLRSLSLTNCVVVVKDNSEVGYTVYTFNVEDPIIVKAKDGYGIISPRNQSIVADFIYDSVEEYVHGSVYCLQKGAYKYLYADDCLSEKCDDVITGPGNAYFVVKQDDKYGVFGYTGKMLAECIYTTYLDRGQAALLRTTSSTDWLVVVKDGSPEGASVYTFAENVAMVVKAEGGYGIISPRNQSVVADFIYESAQEFVPGSIYCLQKDDSKYLYADDKMSAQCEEVIAGADNAYFVVKQNGLYGVLTPLNECLLPCSQTEVPVLQKDEYTRFYVEDAPVYVKVDKLISASEYDDYLYAKYKDVPADYLLDETLAYALKKYVADAIQRTYGTADFDRIMNLQEAVDYANSRKFILLSSDKQNAKYLDLETRQLRDAGDVVYHAFPSKEGIPMYASVRRDGKFGIIDIRNTRVVLPFEYDEIKPIGNGYVLLCKNTGDSQQIYLYNVTTALMVTPKACKSVSLDWIAYNLITIKQDSKVKLYNIADHSWTLPEKHSLESVVLVPSKDTVGVNYAAFAKKGAKGALFSLTTGERLTDYLFDDVSKDLVDGKYHQVTVGKKVGLYDLSSKQYLLACTYERIDSYHKHAGVEYVVVGRDKKYGVYNATKKKLVVQLKYDEIDLKGAYARLKQGNTYKAFSLATNTMVTIKQQVQHIDLLEDGFAVVFTTTGSGIYDLYRSRWQFSFGSRTKKDFSTGEFKDLGENLLFIPSYGVLDYLTCKWQVRANLGWALWSDRTGDYIKLTGGIDGESQAIYSLKRDKVIMNYSGSHCMLPLTDNGAMKDDYIIFHSYAKGANDGEVKEQHKSPSWLPWDDAQGGAGLYNVDQNSWLLGNESELKYCGSGLLHVAGKGIFDLALGAWTFHTTSNVDYFKEADNLYIEEEDGHGVTTAVYWFDEESRALVPVSKTFSIYDYQSLKKVAGVQDYSPKESGSQWKLYDSQSDSYIPFECNRISLMFK